MNNVSFSFNSLRDGGGGGTTKSIYPLNDDLLLIDYKTGTIGAVG